MIWLGLDVMVKILSSRETDSRFQIDLRFVNKGW
jgi:hypothetical protein